MDISKIHFEEMRRYIMCNDLDCQPRMSLMELMIGMLAHYDVRTFTTEELIMVYKELKMTSPRSQRAIIPTKAQAEKICDGLALKQGIFGTKLSKQEDYYETLEANDAWYTEWLSKKC